MKCSRCRGLMVEDHFLDMAGQYEQMWTRGLRCVNCGRVHDSTIEQNRLLRLEKVAALPNVAPDDRDEDIKHGSESMIRRLLV